jgi:hypothetical protein
MVVAGIILSVLCVFINPLYMLIIGSIVETYKKLPTYFNYVLAFSIAIAISNREIGVQWSSANGIGMDDAVNYLNWYHQTEFTSYILNFQDIIINTLNGREPLWFILAEISGIASLYNENFLIFISVLFPVLVFHFSFQKITKYFCFSALVFYFLVPEMFHMLFHLFRTSIGLSIVVLCFAGLLAANKSRSKLIYFAPFGHLSMILPSSVLFFGRFIVFDLSISKKIIGIMILATSFFIGLYALLFIASFIGLEKIAYYLSSEGEIFKLGTRHLIYLILSVYLLAVTKNKNIYLISLSALLVLCLPFSLNGIGLIFERILILFTPLLALCLVYEINGSKLKRVCTIALLSINFLLLVAKIHDQLFYQYMSDGKFFNFFSGLFHNFYTYFL